MVSWETVQELAQQTGFIKPNLLQKYRQYRFSNHDDLNLKKNPELAGRASICRILNWLG